MDEEWEKPLADQSPAVLVDPNSEQVAGETPEQSRSVGTAQGGAEDGEALVDVAALTACLGIPIHDVRWYAQALSHSSWVNERAGGAVSYERLEFLGDAIVNFVVAAELLERLPTAPEGVLSPVRAHIVCGESLAWRADALGIAALARLGNGEEHAGGRTRHGFLNDLFEAIVGAMYFDAGGDVEVARTWVLDHLRAEIDAAIAGHPEHCDYRRLLAERCRLSYGSGAPSYRVLGSSGPDHATVWICAVEQDGRQLAVGTGRSKQAAARDAARRALLPGV